MLRHGAAVSLTDLKGLDELPGGYQFVSRLDLPFRKQSAETFEGYDLIVTNFFLDCFSDSQLADVVARLSSWSLPHVRWIVSDFREAHTPIARFWTRSIVRALYAAFRLTTGLRVVRLPNYAAAIARERYVLRREENSLGGLVHSSLWELRRG